MGGPVPKGTMSPENQGACTLQLQQPLLAQQTFPSVPSGDKDSDIIMDVIGKPPVSAKPAGQSTSMLLHRFRKVATDGDSVSRFLSLTQRHGLTNAYQQGMAWRNALRSTLNLP